MDKDSIIIGANSYVEKTSAISRNTEEHLRIQENDPHYSTLASMVAQNIRTVDKGIEVVSEFAGQYSANLLTQRQYNAPEADDNLVKKAKRAKDRNIHIDPTEKTKRDFQRQLAYTSTRIILELVSKYGVRAALGYMQNKTLYKSYFHLYQFLDCFLQCNRESPGYIRATRELTKIRCSFQIRPKDKTRIKKDTEQHRVQSVDMIDLEPLYSEPDEWRRGIAFYLTALAAQMYEDEEQIKNCLSEFYDAIGFHGNYQREMMRVNSSDYDAITLQQSKMNHIASQMILHLIPSAPSVDFNSIATRSKAIRQFDPYEARRKRNQDAAKATAKVAFSTILQNNPELAFLSSVQALSQFNLNNDNVTGDCINSLRRFYDDDQMAKNAVRAASEMSGSAKAFV